MPSHSVVCHPLRPHRLQPPGASVHGILQGRILEWVACPPPGDLPYPVIKPRSPACRQILHHLSHQGSPRILEWIVNSFSRGSSRPRNQTRVSCIAGGLPYYPSISLLVIYPKKTIISKDTCTPKETCKQGN